MAAAGAAAAGAAATGARGAVARGAATAGAVARGAVAAVAGAAGAVRPGSDSPLGSSWASPAVLDSGAGSAEVSDEIALAGAAAAGAAAGAAGTAGAAGVVGTSGRVSDAVAPGGGVAGAAAGAALPDMADARVDINCGAAAPTVDSWVSSAAPGFGGIGGAGAAGSAAAVALSDSAVTAPAAAIMVDTNNFRVRYMVLPIVGRRRPEPEASLLLVRLK
jgi:hypothetical protein